MTSNEFTYAHTKNIYTYYRRSGRAVRENIRFKAGKAGSIGPTVGRTNTEGENRIFSCTARPKECNNIFVISYPIYLSSGDSGLDLMVVYIIQE